MNKVNKLFAGITSLFIYLLLSVYLFFCGANGYQGILSAKFSLFCVICGGYILLMGILRIEYIFNSSAVEGTRITVEVSPRSGYELDRLSVFDLNTGRELPLTQRYRNEYTFILPDSPVEVEVSFSRENIVTGSWYIPASSKTVSNKPVKWYYKDGQIQHVTDGIVPYGTLLTRDMLISVLYSMDPNSTGEPLFWATQQKVMPDIYPGGLWGTDKNISREQAAMLLYNYSRHMGYDLSPNMDLTGRADYGEMRPIARTAMSWAQATGLFSRNSFNTLSPKSALTCGEVNALLSRFVSTVARIY